MLLRSSSTPVLGSLLSSISESPSNNNHVETSPAIKHPPITTLFHNHNKLSLHQSGSANVGSASCNSSPISPSIATGFRRAQSEGNLERLSYASCNNYDDFYNPKQPQKLSGRMRCSMLQTIPSFSFHNSGGGSEDEEEESDAEEETEEFENKNGSFKRSIEGKDKFMAVGGGEFSWGNKNIGLVKEKGFTSEFRNVSYGQVKEMVYSEMHLARGLGVYGDGIGGFGSGGGGRGGDFNRGESGKDGGDGDSPDMEDYYRRMVMENPGNPLFLRNYAQFLYQSQKDLHGAEEYYSRAILADPKDGEILSQYAKLVWELYRDKDRALSYFERAAQAAPEDSHVHAAYAGFLWDVVEEEEEENAVKDFDAVSHLFHGTMASASG